MARYLVTGGGGFIGSNLTEAFLGEGHDVRVLDNFATGRRENLEAAPAWAQRGGGSFELVDGDIRDPEACAVATNGCDYVLHMAAIPSVQRSVLDPVETNQVNVNGTLNLLQSARENQVRCFVFASSSSIYGESESLPKIETMPSAPISPYGLQKLAGETYCRLFHRLYDLPTVALRFFNVFGPRQDPSSEYSAVIPRFVTALKSGRRPTVYGDGEQSRDFTFVGNVVRINALACAADSEAWGRTYNVGCGSRITLNALLSELRGLLDTDIEAEHAAERPGDIKHSLASIELAQRYLGFSPEIDLAEGLERTLESY